ncbi:MAG: hypothetical protein AB7S26_22005 [Sandaracinaceae bacterium]
MNRHRHRRALLAAIGLTLLCPVGVGRVAAQPPEDGPEEGACSDDWDRVLRDEAEHEVVSVRCDVIGGRTIGLSVESFADERPELVLRYATSPNDVHTASLSALRRASGSADLEWSDEVILEARAIAGIDGAILVSVVTRFGEDYFVGDQTAIVLDVRSETPRIAWAGAGDRELSAMGICHAWRRIEVRGARGTVRISSRVGRRVNREASDDRSLVRELAGQCRSPRRVGARVRL